ncbi:MAG: ABC transporter, partial [Acidobacteria bacterium]
MALVHLHNVSFAYGDRRVLDHLSLQLDPGERVAVIGANGAGKTTLLKVVGGLLRVHAWSVRTDGADVAEIPRRRIARLVASVPQELVIPFSFTVREMVELGRTAYIGLFGGFDANDRCAVDHAMEVT